MDIKLKGSMDGIATAEAIRKRWHIPVIYLTAFSDTNTLQRAKITEPFGYIIKPFEDREMQSTIEMALYKHRAEERLRESERRYAATLTSIGDGVIATDAHSRVTFMNPVAEKLTGWFLAEAQGHPLDEVFKIVSEETRQPEVNPVTEVLREGKVVGLANHTLLLGRNGSAIPIDDCASPILDDLGRITGTVLVFQNVSERRRKEAELRRIEWMLAPKLRPGVAGEVAQQQTYGDLTGLNTSRLILDSVGSDLLQDIVTDYLDLLETSSAVYERNGDYAFGIFSSGWCRFMDQAARNCCATEDNRQALCSGRWHCHESCWTDASKLSIERAEVVDIACRGGLRLHAVPIFAGNEIIGSINCGYGDPPRDPNALRELAELYQVGFEELQHLSGAYQMRPPFIVELAKKRLKNSARLIGEIVRRRTLERRQQESERQYRILFAGNPHPMWVYDLETLAFLAVNDAAIAHYGYSHDEFLAMTIKDIRQPEHIDALLQSVAATTEGVNKVGVWLHRLKNGRIIEVDITSHALIFGNRKAVLVLAYDITERNHLERQLRENEERLRLALLAANQGLYDVDLQSRVVVVSPEYARMLGYDPNNFQESDAAWQDRLHPDERQQVIGVFQEFIEGRCDDYRMEFRQRTRSGDWKWILSVGKIVKRDKDGKPHRILGTHTDITERKKNRGGTAGNGASSAAYPETREPGCAGRRHRPRFQ